MKYQIIILIFFLLISFVIEASEELEAIEVTEEVWLESSGLGLPARKAPLSGERYKTSHNGKSLQRLSDVTQFDASVSDSYNTTGYYDSVMIRGFKLDNQLNFQREGLPINAQTFIPLDNKEEIEVLKGLTGIQAGSASPGGVINYVVKRPRRNQRQLKLEISERRNILTALDATRRRDKAGIRINVAQENIEPLVRDAKGERSLLALSADYRLSEKTLLEWEGEWSRRSQPSVPGFSLLGDKLPSPVDPNINLNNQDWSKPVIFEGLTSTFHWHQQLGSWETTSSLGLQKLKTHDRIAFPYGCSAENNYDRYCSDGTFDLYDFRSENERRDTQVAKFQGKRDFVVENFRHQFNLIGWLFTQKERLPDQTYNFVGTGDITGGSSLPADPARGYRGHEKASQNLDLFIFDQISWQQWKLWLGGRYSEVRRQFSRNDKTEDVAFKDNFFLPWMALSYDWKKFMSYLSWSEGQETFVTPNLASYSNPASLLPMRRARQLEAGIKSRNVDLALFEVARPVITDQAPDYQLDGELRQRGLEGTLKMSRGRWEGQLNFMKLILRREGARLREDLNGKRPVNVPEYTLRSNLSFEITPAWKVDARLIHEGAREVLPDNSLELPAWSRLDAGVSYQRKETLVRLAVENVSATRYWREAPTQYGHVYLYPGGARLLTLTLVQNF